MSSHRHFSIADFSFSLSTNCPTLDVDIAHLLGGFQQPMAPATGNIHFTITHLPNDCIQVNTCGAQPQTYTTPDHFLSQFEHQLILKAFDHMPYLGIHAGAVARDRQALLFPGQSGSGKTSLTLGCLLQGYALLSDEMALITPHDKRVKAFPRVMCVKNRPDIFAAFDSKNKLSQPHIARLINQTLCISPCHFGRVSLDQTCAVQTIVFPSFHPDSFTKLSPICQTDSLKRLIGLTHNRQRADLLDILGALVETAPSYKLSMRNLPEALQEVTSLAA